VRDTDTQIAKSSLSLYFFKNKKIKQRWVVGRLILDIFITAKVTDSLTLIYKSLIGKYVEWNDRGLF
jgi:hypothetical protein